MKRASPDAGRRRVLRTRRHCEGSVPGRAPLSTASLLAGVKMLLGVDPKEDYHDKVAEVNLRG